MKSYLALTWKELKTQKITATLILIAVIMSTIITISFCKTQSKTTQQQYAKEKL